MAKKRFTDAEIWKKKWYRQLGLKGKLLWNYLKDNCDVAGVIDFDEAVASLFIGEEVTTQDALSLFGDRVIELEEDKLILTDYVNFQCKKLSTASKPHQAILNRLEEIGFEFDLDTLSVKKPKGLERVRIELANSSRRVKDKEKEKDKDKEPEKEKLDLEEVKKTTSPHLFDDVRQAYNEILAGTGNLKSYLIPSGTDQRNFAEVIQKHPEFRELKAWENLFEEAKASSKLTGQHPTFNVNATLGWLFIEKNLADVLNGKYQDEIIKPTKGGKILLGDGEEEIEPSEIGTYLERAARAFSKSGMNQAKDYLGSQIWRSLMEATTWARLCESNEFELRRIASQVKKGIHGNNHGAA